MPNGPLRVRPAKTQRNALVTLAYRGVNPPEMTRPMHMPVTRLHVHNDGDSKIAIL
jgi:hypothetical protein